MQMRFNMDNGTAPAWTEYERRLAAKAKALHEDLAGEYPLVVTPTQWGLGLV
jgi:hypothetical protein